MEINESISFFYRQFCNRDKLLKYFEDFRNFLQETDHLIEFYKTEKFLNCVIILDKSDFLNSIRIHQMDLFDIQTDNLFANLNDNFFQSLHDVLLSILEIFCLKYQNVLFVRHPIQDISNDVNMLFDTIAYLVQLFIFEIRNKGYLDALVKNIHSYFSDLTKSMRHIYASSIEFESKPLCYYTMKFLAKIFKVLPSNHYTKYISDADILQLVNVLPFPDNTTVKFFINHILPAVFQFSSPSLKGEVLKSMWSMICTEFQKEDFNEASETNSYIYTMTYCVSAYIYNDDAFESVNFYIHTEITFWEIILAGLTSSFPFTRKKALNIFKMFLMWIEQSKKDEKEIDVSGFSLFSTNTEDTKIWNDVVIVFESLEEKQIHVIKPVLPKFFRILSLASKENSSTDEDKVKLISAWVMAVITRMLKHETKFIVRWALSTVLTIDFKKHILHEDSVKMLFKILLEAFNDQSLYSRNSEQDNYSLFLSSKKISKFLKNYLSTFELHSEKVVFFRNLLSTIASQSWCIVALLHITVALSTIESTPSWNKSDISLIRNIVIDCQRSHEPAFRASLEYFMMECCTLFLDWNSLHIEDIAELLSIFKSTSVSRHSKPWNNFASSIKDLIFNESSQSITEVIATEFCSKSIAKILEVSVTEASDADIEEVELEKTAKILMCIADASVISSESAPTGLNWISLLNPVISTIQCASNRPYMHNKKFLSSLKLITLLMKESYDCDRIELDPHTMSIVASLNQCPEMMEILHQKLFMNGDSNNISQNYIIFEFFDTVVTESRLNGLFLNIIPQMINKIEIILEDEQLRKNLLFSVWKILVRLVDDGLAINLATTIHSINFKILSKVLSDGIVQECLSKPAGLDDMRKEQWLRFSYQSVCNFWHVACSVIPHLSDDEMAIIMLPLIEEAEKVFNNGPKTAVPYAIRSLKDIIPRLGKLNLSVLSELLEVAWKSCLELRGNEAFRPSLSSLIEIIFQMDMMQETFFPFIEKYFKCFKDLSESTSGIFYTCVKQFYSAIPLCTILESGFNCVHIFVFALTFGPIHQKAHKIMEETLIYLLEQDPQLNRCLTLVDSNRPSCYVRITTLEYLFKSLKETKESEDFVFLLIEELMKVDSDDDCKKTSHFANSLSHRIRNRAWQSILLFQPFIKDKALNEKLLLKALNALAAESQQPSIRYLQEWVVFNVLHIELSFVDKFISIMDESVDKRPSYIISVISVANLLILHHVLNEKNDIKKCFNLLIIFSMAQNFTVRLYSQVTLTNLFNLCKQMNFSSLIIQYEFVSQMIDLQASMVEGHGNFFKNVKKLSSDFYFSAFNPINHFSLETVLYDLPRLSNLSPDEWIRPDWFHGNCFHVLTCNLDDNLKKSSPTSWSSKMSNDNSISKNDSLDYNFQKKITPVKDMIASSDDVILSDLVQKKSQEEGLIVVASLIDRVPNLGGLCRTCEVFGVSEFVISSLLYMEDKQFQNLAVSADKWVPIKEVKPHVLKQYLISVKEKGFTLVGAEQTEDSRNLKEYVFPKKSVLLLGHEKEGLPVDLIQLLDVCVEIPQQGVVRSLNVHVSGAILIWEYARQHNNSS